MILDDPCIGSLGNEGRAMRAACAGNVRRRSDSLIKLIQVYVNYYSSLKNNGSEPKFSIWVYNKPEFSATRSKYWLSDWYLLEKAWYRGAGCLTKYKQT